LRAAGIAPEVVVQAMTSAGIESQSRAEALPIEALAELWKKLQMK
jgi:hypothetical protein